MAVDTSATWHCRHARLVCLSEEKQMYIWVQFIERLCSLHHMQHTVLPSTWQTANSVELFIVTLHNISHGQQILNILHTVLNILQGPIGDRIATGYVTAP